MIHYTPEQRRELILKERHEHPDIARPEIPAVPGNSGIYELYILHPAIEQWLTDNGYEYQHHVRIEHVGIADFVASRGNEQIVIEAKAGCKNISRALNQLLDYRRSINPEATPILALPQGSVTEAAEKLCSNRDVQIVTFDIEPLDKGVPRQKEHPKFPTEVWLAWFWDNCVSMDGKIDYSQFTEIDHEEMRIYSKAIRVLRTRS